MPLTRGLLARLGIVVDADLETFNRQLGDAQSRLIRTSERFTSIGRQMSFALTAPLVAVGVLATRELAQFEEGLRNVNTIARETEEELGRTGKRIRELSVEFGRSTADVAAAEYQIVSAVFLETAERAEILNAAIRAGRAGLANTASSAKLLSSILNAYAVGAENAQTVSDILFKTVERGQTTFGELSGFMQNVIAVAALLNVRFDELGAAVATLTKSGFDTARATVSLNRALDALINPSKEMTKLLTKLGYESGVALIKEQGLAGTFKILNKEVGGNAVAMKELFPNIRAFRAAAVLAGKGARLFAEDIRELTDASRVAGATQRAFEQQQKSLAIQLDILRETFKEFLRVLGEDFRPLTQEIIELLKNAVKAFQSLPGPIRKASVALLALVALVGPLTYGFGLLLRAIGAVSISLTARFARALAVTIPKLLLTNRLVGIGVPLFAKTAKTAKLAGTSFFSLGKRMYELRKAIIANKNAAAAMNATFLGFTTKGLPRFQAATGKFIAASTVSGSVALSSAGAATKGFAALGLLLAKVAVIAGALALAYQGIKTAIFQTLGEGDTFYERQANGADKLKQKLTEIIDKILGVNDTYLTAADAMRERTDALKDKWEDLKFVLSQTFGRTLDVVYATVTLFFKNIFTLVNYGKTVWEAYKSSLAYILGSLVNTIFAFFRKMSLTFSEIGNFLRDVASKSWEAYKSSAIASFELLKEGVSSVFQKIRLVLEENGLFVRDYAKAIKGAFKGKFDPPSFKELQKRIKDGLDKITEESNVKRQEILDKVIPFPEIDLQGLKEDLTSGYKEIDEETQGIQDELGKKVIPFPKFPIDEFKKNSEQFIEELNRIDKAYAKRGVFRDISKASQRAFRDTLQVAEGFAKKFAEASLDKGSKQERINLEKKQARELEQLEGKRLFLLEKKENQSATARKRLEQQFILAKARLEAKHRQEQDGLQDKFDQKTKAKRAAFVDAVNRVIEEEKLATAGLIAARDKADKEGNDKLVERFNQAIQKQTAGWQRLVGLVEDNAWDKISGLPEYQKILAKITKITKKTTDAVVSGEKSKQEEINKTLTLVKDASNVWNRLQEIALQAESEQKKAVEPTKEIAPIVPDYSRRKGIEGLSEEERKKRGLSTEAAAGPTAVESALKGVITGPVKDILSPSALEAFRSAGVGDVAANQAVTNALKEAVKTSTKGDEQLKALKELVKESKKTTDAVKDIGALSD